MAGVIVNNPVLSGVIRPTQYTSVWVKPYWGATWRYVPYLFPERSTEAVAPADSTASYTWEYGEFLNLWGDPGGTLFPINLENWFIATKVHTVYGTYISWIGVVVGETMQEEGIDTVTGYPRGNQRLECRGLEYLLERRNVLGTYVGDTIDGAESWVYLDRTRNFNRSNSRRESLAGNRSNYVNSTSGSYLFGTGGAWTNNQIANYLLATFQPWVSIGTMQGAMDYVPLFRLSGQTEGLDSIIEHHGFHGRTVRECLNNLIDRRRGFGWHIQTDGVGPIYIRVFSLSQYPITGVNAYLPANPRQIDVAIHDDPWIKASYRISSTTQVDEIVVQSDTPVKTCATLSFLLGTLEPAWDPARDSDLTPGSENYPGLAEHVLENFATYDNNGDLLLTIYGFANYANAFPAQLAFLGGVTSSTINEAFSNLDNDKDGKVSVEDLEYWIANTTTDTYQTVTEEERATDRYAAVFSDFQVPKDWTWDGWAVGMSSLGYVNLSGSGNYWNHDAAFLRHLPFVVPGAADDTEREYMEPFAVVQKQSRNRMILLALADAGAAPYSYLGALAVDDSITPAEFDALDNESDQIGWDELYAGLEANPEVYLQLDRAQQIEITPGGDRYPACSLRMGDAGLKISIKSEANHIFGLNHFDVQLSEIAPLFDYETLLATVFIETDVMPRVRIPIYTATYETYDSDGNPITVGERTPTGRQIYIEVPDKEVWIAAPNTVTGLDGELLEYFRDGAAGIIRDDTDDLRFIALIAYIWYGQQRASAEFQIANQLRFFMPGDLIRSTISGWWFERIGTCVTSIDRDYQAGTHTVTTGYGELDPGAFADVRHEGRKR